MIRLYNVLRKFCYLSDVKETKGIEVEEDEVVAEELKNAGLNKALDLSLIHISEPTRPY